jgi:hypothetical protein
MEVHSSLKLTKLLMKMCLVHLIWILFTILTETNNGNNVQAIYHGNPDNVHKSKFGCVILLSHVFLLHPLPKLLLKFYSKSYSYLKYKCYIYLLLSQKDPRRIGFRKKLTCFCRVSPLVHYNSVDITLRL